MRAGECLHAPGEGSRGWPDPNPGRQTPAVLAFGGIDEAPPALACAPWAGGAACTCCPKCSPEAIALPSLLNPTERERASAPPSCSPRRPSLRQAPRCQAQPRWKPCAAAAVEAPAVTKEAPAPAQNGSTAQRLVRFGFPKGSLQKSTEELFARAGAWQGWRYRVGEWRAWLLVRCCIGRWGYRVGCCRGERQGSSHQSALDAQRWNARPS